MNPALLLFIARRHLSSNFLRTCISVGGVAIGVCFMIMMSSLMTGFEGKFVKETIESSPHVTVFDDFRAGEDDFDHWADRAAGGPVEVEGGKPRSRIFRIKKPLEILDSVRRLEGIEAAAPNVVGSSILSFGAKETGSTMYGIDPEAQEAVVATDQYVQGGRMTDLYSSGGAVIVGSGVAERLGVKKGDTIGVSLRSGGTRSLKVVAILHTGVTTIDFSRSYVLVSLAQQVLGMGRDVNRIVMRLRDHTQAPEIAVRVEKLVGYRTESWQEANQNFLSIFVLQQAITYIVTSGIMIVAGFGILNILIMLVLEKYPEIAMMKSMGFTARDIALAFFIEGVAIGILGVLVGSSLGYYLTEFVGTLPIPQKGLVESEHLIMNNMPRNYYIAAAAAMLVTMVASVLPALRAGRMDPVETLRGHA
ncbi:MAG: ABC transporter permease [Planctomycetes bacterium]|nr:ABC transporter permease [Planctomycetota bacterium]